MSKEREKLVEGVGRHCAACISGALESSLVLLKKAI